MTHISIIAQLLLFPTFFFILYISTKSLKVKNWNKSKIRSSNKFLQLSLSIDQCVCVFNSTTTLSWVTHARLFHTVANLTMALDYGFDRFFLTWILCILTNTFVITSTNVHSSNGNTKFVKRERDIFKTQTTAIIKLISNVALYHYHE